MADLGHPRVPVLGLLAAGHAAGGRTATLGLDFYDQLVDGLLERDITPLLTLYHWDLPQYLQDSGGWTDRTTVDRFVELAELIGASWATGYRR